MQSVTVENDLSKVNQASSERMKLNQVLTKADTDLPECKKKKVF